MQDIHLNKETNTLSISNELLEKVKYLIGNSGFLKYDIDKYVNLLEKSEFYYNNLISIISKITERINSNYKFYIDNEEMNNINSDLYNKFLALMEEYNEYNRKDLIRMNRKNIDETLNTLSSYINLIYEINKQYKNLDILRDLYRLKDDFYKNMSYFKTEEEMKIFMNKYLEYIKQGGTEDAKDMILELQSKILDEWKKYDGNVEEMTDDNFCFIGHSTISTQFDKDFFDNYVSASLFNQDINDTYKNSYGFIMPSTNIVGAKSKDMYVANNSDNDENILFYSLIPQIDHPKKVLEETLNQKEENIKNEKSKKVYNEIIEKGFSPIGLFCFTDGTLTLDSNYSNFLKLKESFPHLKAKAFDTFKRKKGTDLVQAKLKIINSLKKDYFNKKGIYFFDKIEEMELDCYEYFFERFNQLKEKENYTEDDIRKIYIKNKEYIEYTFEFDDLFTEKYNDEERKIILGNSCKLNINKILSGNINKISLINIGNKLKNYIGKLNKYYPGLDEFVSIMNEITIDDELVNQIAQLENINFYTMTKLVITKKKDDIQKNSTQTKSNIDSLKENYIKAKEELNEREKLKKEYEYYENIFNQKYVYELALIDIRGVQEKNKFLTEENNQLEIQLVELKKQLQQLEENKLKFKEEQEIKEIKEKLSELHQVQAKLKRHPLFNRKKINMNQEEMMKYNMDLSKRKEIYLSNIDLKLYTLKPQIEFIENMLNKNKESLNRNTQELESLENKIHKIFGLNLAETKVLIDEAEEYLKKNNFTQNFLNNKEIKTLKQELENILLLLEDEMKKLDSNHTKLENIDEISEKKHQTK